MLRIAWSPEYVHPLPEGHRFPMEKYALLVEQLVYEGTVTDSAFFRPEPASEDILRMTHCGTYLTRLKNLELTRQEERKTGFPLSAALIERELRIMEGTRRCAEYALQYGVAMNIAGGTHHAYTDRGEGFCLLNDNAVAANYLLHTGRAKRILIVDLDVHQGNGTAAIFSEVPEVFTFSMHGEKNYPLHKELSDLDIALPDGTGDAAYLDILKHTLPELFDRHQPDFVFYQCGVDVLAGDKLGRLSLSAAGCRERDRLVIGSCHRNRVPLVCSMGGGYSPRIADIVEAHAATFRVAQELFF